MIYIEITDLSLSAILGGGILMGQNVFSVSANQWRTSEGGVPVTVRGQLFLLV